MKYVMSLLLASVILVANAQVVEVSNERDYQAAKLSGAFPVLTSRQSTEKIKFEPGKLDLSKVKQGSSRMGGGGQDECDCIKPVDDTYSVVPFTNGQAPEYRNDDGSSPEIELPFTFCLYGAQYNSCWINTNGNVTFDGAFGTFSASGFPNNQNIMVAPFWADVDIRNPESGLVYYKVTDHYMIVYWDAVGYFNNMADKLNSFQLIISDGSDPIIPNGGTVSFCYGDMEWTTGSASGGVDGFGGTAATVGANRGDGLNFFQAGRFSVPGIIYDGPTGEDDGVSWLDNLIFAFNSCTAVDSGNLIPISPLLTACNIVYLCAGNEVTVTFLGPEPTQLLTIDWVLADPTAPFEFVLNPPEAGVSTLDITAPLGMTPGSYDITITAADNGIPSQQVTIFYTFIVIETAGAIDIQGPTSICSGEPALLSIIPGYTNIQWSNGSAGNSITVEQPGTYTVEAVLGGCETSGTITIDLAETAIPIIQGDNQICSTAQTTLTTTEEFVSYEWSTGSSASSISAGVGTVSVTTTDANGCVGTGNFTITALANPSVVNSFLVCDSFESELTGNDVPGSWTVEPATGLILVNSDQTDTEIIAEAYGEYDLTFTHAECNTTDELTVRFLPSPDVFLPNVAEVCFGEAITIQPNSGNFQYIDSYEWENDGSTDFVYIFSTPRTFIDSLVIFTAQNDCATIRDTVTVKQIICNIIIPNVFTPNGDGENNALSFGGITQYPGNTLQVFNRWGALIFESENYQNNWIPSENEIGDGVYYFVLGINRPGGMEYVTGEVTIIR
jgi:gliding motility-associated-like protein